MIQVKIRGRVLNISDEGLSPLEMSAVAGQVEKKISDLEEKLKLVDGAKLAMLAAIELAIELFKLKKQIQQG